MSYLVDANVLSEATRPRAETRVVDWLDQHDTELHVSVITLGEIFKGIRLLASGPKQQRLTRWLAELEASFEERILPVDRAVMREWAALYARHQKAGRLYSSFDSLVAATAVRHELTVVTRNESDFPPEIPLLNPGTRRNKNRQQRAAAPALCQQGSHRHFDGGLSAFDWDPPIIAH